MKLLSVLLCLVSNLTVISASADQQPALSSQTFTFEDKIDMTDQWTYPQQLLLGSAHKLKQFDPAMGTLKSVEFQVFGEASTSYRIIYGDPSYQGWGFTMIWINSYLPWTGGVEGLFYVYEPDQKANQVVASGPVGKVYKFHSSDPPIYGLPKQPLEYFIGKGMLYEDSPYPNLSPFYVQTQQYLQAYPFGLSTWHLSLKIEVTYFYEPAPPPVKICKVADKGRVVPNLKQYDPAWGSDKYAFESVKTVKSLGCATTSANMVFNSYGINLDYNGNSLNPKNMNDGFKKDVSDKNTGPTYLKNGSVDWIKAAEFARLGYAEKCVREGRQYEDCLRESGSKVSFKKMMKKSTGNFDAQKIEDEICEGNPVILEVPGLTDSSRAHFVVATEVTNESGQRSFRVNDPGGQNSTFDEVDVRGARLYAPARDPNMILIATSENVDFVLIDPQGRRHGKNPITGQVYSEIANTQKYDESIASSDSLDLGATTTTRILINTDSPLVGNYQLEIYPISSGPYTAEIRGYDADGFSNFERSLSGLAVVGQTIRLNFDHTDLPKPSYEKGLLSANALILPWLLRLEDEQRGVFNGRLRSSVNPNAKFEFTGDYDVEIEIENVQKVQIPASDLRNWLRKKNPQLVWTKGDSFYFFINSKGEFSFWTKSKNLLSQAKKGSVNIRLRVGNIQGKYKMTTKCSRVLCEGK